ncbi:MAG: oligosaccharide flippase family protein [Planctomycetales bacterium]|nr:oligosaccharide flippase family protein [Planctomycetales bacterium]
MELTTEADNPNIDSARGKSTGDYLLTGVAVMLVVNFAQRIVGLVRGLGFCHFLSDEQLGNWSLANSFFVIGVPLALLGLPGGFGRFVEHYRRQNHLGDYLVNVLCVTSLGLLVISVWMLWAPNSFSWLVFHQAAAGSYVIWCLVTFISLVVFSVVYEIVAALREVRVMSLMQFLQSTVFALIGLPLIATYGDWLLLLPSYAIACSLASLLGIAVLWRGYGSELVPRGSLDRCAMWSRIIPFAASLWLMNFLSNLFEVSDRYMLLHLCSGGVEAGQAAVGQYHCGRILPNLFVSIALMLSGVLLPYMSADWESGRREQIAASMRQMIQSTCMAFMAISIGALSFAPLVFQYGLGGRYGAAESLLPLALAHVIWVSIFLIAETYLLCAERGRQLIQVLVAGLCVNVALNWWLIHAYGLIGAVAATSIAGLFTLLLLFGTLSRNGCSVDVATVVLCCTPIAVAFGAIPAALILCIVVVVAGRTNWLLSDADRQQIDRALLPRLKRWGVALPTIWP